MKQPEIIKKIQYAIQINSELPELELKTAASSFPKDIWKSISAFSHRRGGGIIAFGIKENPVEVAGCQNIAEMQKKIIEWFNDKMSFILRPTYYVIPWDHTKTILAVYVPECPKEYRPCYYKHVGLPHGAYIREGTTNRLLTDNEFRNYVALSKEFQFDISEAPKADYADLSESKIKSLLEKQDRILRRGASSEINIDLLKNISVLADFDGESKPTIAGFLIFAKDSPQSKYPHPYERYTVRCVRYAGNSSASDIIDKLDVIGTLDEQIEETYKFVLKNIRTIAVIKGTKRRERYEYPEKAIRELIANAIIHRDYKIFETYTQIHVFQDRLEIASPGSLPPGVTIENIKDAQYSRNIVIAARLKDLRYLEEYGRGIDIVFSKMEEWDLPLPLFRNSVNRFEAILLGSRFSKLNLRQRKIIDYLFLKKQLAIKDCLKLLKNVPRVTVNADLRKLKEMGILEQRGTSSSTHYLLGI